MIAPGNRLLFWVAAVVLPFAALGALVPHASGVSVVAVAVLLAAAGVDAYRVSGRSRISVELPGVVRFSKGREGAIELRLRSNEGGRTERVRLALEFPADIETPDESLNVLLPGDGSTFALSWTCAPRKRGRYFINRCFVERASPLGFWVLRDAVPVSSELRVYSNLLRERQSLAALFLNRGNFGIHSRRQVGQGRDFEKLRQYIHGDSYDHIHWKVTAKRGRPVTKVFQVERTQEVYVVLDTSRLSARSADPESRRAGGGRQNESMLERFITAAHVMQVATQRQGDLFGLLSFSDRVNRFIRAKAGRAHYNCCRDALYTLEPQIVTPDFDELCSFISIKLRRRALLVFLTCLDDPALAESFARNMELISRKHLVMVNMLKSGRVQPLFLRTGVENISDVYAELGGHILWHELLELGKTLKRRGVYFSLLNNERMCADLVSGYADIKQRQML